MGQRIAKTVTNKNVTTGDKKVTTYYVCDPRGNVLAVILDEASTSAEPTIVSLSDYYPYGMTELQRSWNAGDYRFGYTGHEKENDLAEGVYTTEYRLLDTRLGRWMSVDPLFAKYADMSSYNYCMGNPMRMMDPDGRDGYEVTVTYKENGEKNGEASENKEITVYLWFDDLKAEEIATEDSYKSIYFKRVTDNKTKWDEATTIRLANVKGLWALNPSASSDEIIGMWNDVRLYDASNPLFTKESHLLNPEKYTSGWDSELNSETNKHDSHQSKEIRNTGFSLKLYDTKGGQTDVNSLGVVKSNFIEHVWESGMEIIERLIYKDEADDDPLNDMHYENAKSLLEKLEKK